MVDQPERTREKPAASRKSVVTETPAFECKEQTAAKALGKTALKPNPGANANSKGHALLKAPAGAQSAKKTEANKQAPARGPAKVTVDALKESLVCLTQDQLQQILSTISQASGSSTQDQGPHSQPKAGERHGPELPFWLETYSPCPTGGYEESKKVMWFWCKSGNLLCIHLFLLSKKAPGEDSEEDGPVSQAATGGTVDALPSKGHHSPDSNAGGRAQEERWGLALRASERPL